MNEGDDVEDIFVDELPDYLKCPICLCCLSNPYQTPCGHRFCKECILPVINSRNNVCPKDRTVIDLSNTFPDNAVRLQINSLKIKCPKQGCDWVGELSDKQNHLKRCKFVDVPCDLCGIKCQKVNLEKHKSECPQRKVLCDYCEIEIPFADKSKHFDECSKYPFTCEYHCQEETIPRQDIEEHYASECPRVPVPCTMAPFGCRDKVERGKLGDHVVQCAPRHASEMASTILTLKKDMEELKLSLISQNGRIDEVESTVYPALGQFTWRVDNIRDKIKQAQAGDPSASVIYSPSFYSGEAGYKLCLCIYPAGDNNQGFLSLYFVVMKGQFDEILPWPFQKRVYLSLLNTKGGQSVMKDIQPDPRLHYFHRPENPRNVGYGYPKFIALQKLLQEDSDYVENEALFLRSRVYD